MDRVYKRFRKGEVFTSLRDLIPALTGRMFRQGELSSNDKREFWALQDISFEVAPGEALGIIGSNGAGKSTILKILSRIMQPTKGDMIVNGRLSALIEVAAGFHYDLTGRENIYLNGTILGMKRREIDSKLDQIIDFSGIEEFIDTPVKRYSSGMYARLGFSVAAHVDPDVLIVDEVLSVGDYVFQRKCMERMREVTRSGAAVLFVSHNLTSIAEFCDRCLLLERGRVAKIGPTEEVIRAYTNGFQAERSVDESQPVWIADITVRKGDEECQRFESGETAWVDIDVTARTASQRLSVSLYLSNLEEVGVMDTSTERLGHGTFSIEPGEVIRFTFEINLNLVAGSFQVSAIIHRYDISVTYDEWYHARTVIITSDRDVRGIVNVFPRVVAIERLTGPEGDAVLQASGRGRTSGVRADGLARLSN
jgi:lipopolysaccharide transport system ATP-binding protein